MCARNSVTSAHRCSWLPWYRERRYVGPAAWGWRGSCWGSCRGGDGTRGSRGSHGRGSFGSRRRLQEIQRISVQVKKQGKTNSIRSFLHFYMMKSNNVIWLLDTGITLHLWHWPTLHAFLYHRVNRVNSRDNLLLLSRPLVFLFHYGDRVGEWVSVVRDKRCNNQ